MTEAIWISAGPLADLPAGRARVLRTGEQEVAVFNLDGTLRAVDNRCLHRGGSLADGLVRAGIVTCPRHWWRYDLMTGQRLGAPGLCLQTYPVEVRNGEILVEVPAPTPPVTMRERLLQHARAWYGEQG